MRTKRYISLLLAALMALTLTACGGDKDKDKETDGDMTIQPAQLTEEEQALADLLALGMGSHHIFSFQVKGAKSVQLQVYELVDGEWSLLQSPGGAGLSAENGRIALSFGKLTDGARVAIQCDGQVFSNEFRIEPADDVSGMSFGTSTLGKGPTDVELDQEIPLALQVATSTGELRMYQVDYFEMPRELAKAGYEHIYAITATFSAKNFGAAPSVPSAGPSAQPSPEQ